MSQFLFVIKRKKLQGMELLLKHDQNINSSLPSIHHPSFMFLELNGPIYTGRLAPVHGAPVFSQTLRVMTAAPASWGT